MATSTPRAANRIIGAFSEGISLWLTEIRPTVETTVTTKVLEVVTAASVIVDKNFPTGSIPERTVKGPIVTLLKNSVKDISTLVSTNIMQAYDGVVSALETRAETA